MKVQWVAFCVFVDKSIRLIFTMKIPFKGIVTWTGVVCVKLCSIGWLVDLLIS